MSISQGQFPIIKLAVLALFAATLSCNKGGGVTVRNNGGSGGGGSFSVAINLTYPTSQGAAWVPIVSANRIYVKGLDITVTGNCSRGVATIQVNEGGANYPETAACPDSGAFIWNKTYTAVTQEGDKTLTFAGYDVGGSALSGATATLSVRIDNTPPATPLFTSPSSNPFHDQGVSNTYNITGTVPADMVSMIGPGGSSIPITSGTFSYTASLVDASALAFAFYGFDLAGNQSATATQTITWDPSVIIYLSGSIPGGSILDSVTNYEMETNGGPFPTQVTNVSTNYNLETGFNYLVNQLRAQ